MKPLHFDIFSDNEKAWIITVLNVCSSKIGFGVIKSVVLQLLKVLIAFICSGAELRKLLQHYSGTVRYLRNIEQWPENGKLSIIP